MWNKKGSLKNIVLLAMLPLLTACPGGGGGGDDSLNIGPVLIEPAPDPNTYVCNPLDGDPDGVQPLNSGLIATLYYRDEGQPRYYSAMDYVDKGTKYEDLDLYISHLDVPTRPFDRGFITEGGLTLTTLGGDTLYEFFALDMRSQLQLAGSDFEGDYQIAILSDDGAVLSIDQGNGLELLIDNDGDHATKMGCAANPVNLSAGVKRPLRLTYYQGPRYHISLVVMYRPWPANPSDVNDPLCGHSGNSLFFDSNQSPPVPTSSYQDLLDRGWKVLTPDHYALPSDSGNNPCNEPAPVILDQDVLSVGKNNISLSWVTDIGSTSQVRFVNVSTGESSFSPLDSEYVTNHGVNITGLQSNTLYELYLISRSISGRMVVSDSISVRTSR